MSNYFVLSHKRPKPQFDAHMQGILLNNKKEIIPSRFNKGDIIKDKGKYFIKVNDKDSESGIYRDKLSVCIQNNEALFVCTYKAQQLLKNFSDDVEFYDLSIIKDRVVNDDYKIVNIIRSVDCINRESSKLVYWELTHETVYNIDELVLKQEVIPPQLNIFLLGGVRASVIVVHEQLKNAIQDKKITGFNFQELKDFVL